MTPRTLLLAALAGLLSFTAASAEATCVFGGKEYSQGATVFESQAVQVCGANGWQVKDIGLLELREDLPEPASAGGDARDALRDRCVFYGGIQGNRLTLVNRCNECRLGTIRWTKWTGGSTIASYRVPALSQTDVAMAGQSSSLMADNPCGSAEPAGDEARGRLCIAEECNGCLSAPACVNALVGDECTLHGHTGKCIQIKTCPRAKACCGCQVGNRVYACDGKVLEVGKDGELLGLLEEDGDAVRKGDTP